MATKTTKATLPTLDDGQRPPEPTAELLAEAQAGAVTATVGSALDTPTMGPPGTAAATAGTGAGWLTNKHVLMLWQTASPLDNWAYLDGGVNWKHVTQGNEAAARAMALLTSAARATGGIVTAYEGTTGAIDALYLW